MLKVFTVALLLVSSFVRTISYAQNIPILGSSGEQVWDKAEELDIGKAIYVRLLSQGNIYQSQADQDYLDYLGNQLGTFAHTRLGLHFYLTRSTSINAFASPGGYVGINAGLVLATDNEHELAGVLAHEIAHVSQEHIARTILAAKHRQVLNSAALIAGALMATTTNSQAGASVLSTVIAAETQQQLNDIRSHEKEADRIGRQIMTKAGFNTLGLQTFFQKLYTPDELTGTPAYLMTHPLPINRQADIDTLKTRSQSLKSSDEYYLFRARIRAALLDQKTLSHLIRKDRKSENPQIRNASHYLVAIKAMSVGKFQTALDALTKINNKMRNNRDVKLLEAKLYLLSQKHTVAQSLYQQLWKSYQGDSVIAYDYARFLSSKGDDKTAAKLLKNQLNNERLNPQLYWLYGNILGKLGQRDKQHRVLIRYYQQSGDYQKALAQATIAAQQSENGQDRSMFQAKQKELQRLIDNLTN